MIDATVPLMPPKVMRVQLPEAGSAALNAQSILGEHTTVVSAFQNISAELLQTDAKIDCDVLVAGDLIEARNIVIDLALMLVLLHGMLDYYAIRLQQKL